jgi:hypothetical protein
MVFDKLRTNKLFVFTLALILVCVLSTSVMAFAENGKTKAETAAEDATALTTVEADPAVGQEEVEETAAAAGPATDSEELVVQNDIEVQSVQPLANDDYAVSDSPFTPNTWYLYCDMKNLVNASTVTVNISFPYGGGSLVNHWITFYSQASQTDTVPPASISSDGLSANINGLATQDGDFLEFALTWSKVFAGTATITVQVDGTTRYSNTITGTLAPPASVASLDCVWGSTTLNATVTDLSDVFVVEVQIAYQQEDGDRVAQPIIAASINGSESLAPVFIQSDEFTDLFYVSVSSGRLSTDVLNMNVVFDTGFDGKADCDIHVINRSQHSNAASDSHTFTGTYAPPPTSKDITSLSINGVAGTISGTNIAVTVPYGTDVTALEPAITHTGANITPTGVQDFTNPVQYTVTAQNGSTATYSVQVTVSTIIPVVQGFGTWAGTGTATAKVNVPLAKFQRLLAPDDTVLVAGKDYDVAEGSTVITLSESYLKTLENGAYAFSAEFSDGTAYIPLEVGVTAAGEKEETVATGDNDTNKDTGAATPASGLPKTGDLLSALLWTVALASGLGGVSLLLFAQRRRIAAVFRR